SAEMHELEAISLPSLPGTEKESDEVKARATTLGWQVATYNGATATEAELRRLHSPRVLHIATHGFFLPDIDLAPQSTGPSRSLTGIAPSKLINPMHRSGLAVAGAQRTLRMWDHGQVPPTDNDGIVTAEEVGELSLDATWLVVLSACDTGGGEF